jgi:hypothetical protein
MPINTITFENTGAPPKKEKKKPWKWDKGLTKREKVKVLRDHHEKIFEGEQVKFPKFVTRCCYLDNTLGEKVVGLFPKELFGKKDVYIEFCSRDTIIPEDPERTLWKWEYNPDYLTEYKLANPIKSTGDRRCLIPADELINVTELYSEKPMPKPVEIEEVKAEEKETKEETVTSPKEELSLESVIDADHDVPFNLLTAKDIMAIIWKKPISHKKWINDVITKTFSE